MASDADEIGALDRILTRLALSEEEQLEQVMLLHICLHCMLASRPLICPLAIRRRCKGCFLSSSKNCPHKVRQCAPRWVKAVCGTWEGRRRVRARLLLAPNSACKLSGGKRGEPQRRALAAVLNPKPLCACKHGLSKFQCSNSFWAAAPPRRQLARAVASTR